MEVQQRNVVSPLARLHHQILSAASNLALKFILYTKAKHRNKRLQCILRPMRSIYFDNFYPEMDHLK